MQSCELSWVLCLPQSKASRREDEAGEDVAESCRATGLWRAPQTSGRKDGCVRCTCVCVMGVQVWAVNVCMWRVPLLSLGPQVSDHVEKVSLPSLLLVAPPLPGCSPGPLQKVPGPYWKTGVFLRLCLT